MATATPLEQVVYKHADPGARALLARVLDLEAPSLVIGCPAAALWLTNSNSVRPVIQADTVAAAVAAGHMKEGEESLVVWCADLDGLLGLKRVLPRLVALQTKPLAQARLGDWARLTPSLVLDATSPTTAALSTGFLKGKVLTLPLGLPLRPPNATDKAILAMRSAAVIIAARGVLRVAEGDLVSDAAVAAADHLVVTRPTSAGGLDMTLLAQAWVAGTSVTVRECTDVFNTELAAAYLLPLRQAGDEALESGDLVPAEARGCRAAWGCLYSDLMGMSLAQVAGH